jgi:cytochrome c-type biogenesis protein
VTEVSIAVAFAAGALSFLSPCVLALVPVYLAFLGTAAVEDDAQATLTASGAAAAAAGAAVLPQALLFVAGFSIVFIVVGTSIGIIGQPLFSVPAVRQVAGIVVIGLGLLTTGLFGPVLDRFRIGLDPAARPTARSLRAVSLGAFVAVGWTPCIGPVLGAILTMGASSGSAPVVALLLTAYSIGLAVPFLAAAVALPHLRPLLDFLRRHHREVQVVTGLLIVAIGVLIYLNAFARLATLFTFAL